VGIQVNALGQFWEAIWYLEEPVLATSVYSCVSSIQGFQGFVFASLKYGLVRVSGRITIAQQFTAGSKE